MNCDIGIINGLNANEVVVHGLFQYIGEIGDPMLDCMV